MSIKARIEDAKLTTVNDGQDGVYECRVVVYESASGSEAVLGSGIFRAHLDNGPMTTEKIQDAVNRFAARLLTRYRNRPCIDCDAITLDPDL